MRLIIIMIFATVCDKLKWDLIFSETLIGNIVFVLFVFALGLNDVFDFVIAFNKAKDIIGR